MDETARVSHGRAEGLRVTLKLLGGGGTSWTDYLSIFGNYALITVRRRRYPHNCFEGSFRLHIFCGCCVFCWIASTGILAPSGCARTLAAVFLRFLGMLF